MASLPSPRLERVRNQTGLAMVQYMKMAPGRFFCDVLAVKASFALTPGGIEPTPMPGLLCMADAPRDLEQSLFSSLSQAGDVILGKPGADLYVSGSARCAQPSPRWQVALGLGPAEKPQLAYDCVALGPRVWQHSLLSGWTASEPEATQVVPIQYELAYGGVKPLPGRPPEEWETFEANPSGTGFSFDGCSRSDTPAAPQWESSKLAASINTPELVGLGPVARPWASRRRYAGTYDEAWERMRKEQHPVVDYPKDFDLRFFQCAHPRLQTPGPLKGDEELRLKGLLAEAGELRTSLPGWTVAATRHADAARTSALPLDTVHIDLDKQQVHLVWHLTLPHALAVHTVELKLEKL